MTTSRPAFAGLRDRAFFGEIDRLHALDREHRDPELAAEHLS
jgi:hypothetical protein